LTERLAIHFYELGKVPEAIDTSDMVQLWLKLIGAKTEEDLAALEELEVAEMTQAVDAYRKISASPRYQELERMRAEARRDEAQALSDAREQGLEQGLAQGLEQGLAQGKRLEQEDTARSLLAMGLDISQISEVTKLTPKEIESLGVKVIRPL